MVGLTYWKFQPPKLKDLSREWGVHICYSNRSLSHDKIDCLLKETDEWIVYKIVNHLFNQITHLIATLTPIRIKSGDSHNAFKAPILNRVRFKDTHTLEGPSKLRYSIGETTSNLCHIMILCIFYSLKCIHA